uniref:Uncharacterized protein n=1 Tax=Anguilla anguilla TaxID=7936 RepID=A0A0E9TU63_ANGAN
MKWRRSDLLKWLASAILIHPGFLHNHEQTEPVGFSLDVMPLWCVFNIQDSG